MEEEDSSDEFGCGNIPLEDIVAYMDINQNPKIDSATLQILLERGSYGNSWREIESYFQNHFSECPDCRTGYDEFLMDYETTKSGFDEIKRQMRNYRKRDSQ